MTRRIDPPAERRRVAKLGFQHLCRLPVGEEIEGDGIHITRPEERYIAISLPGLRFGLRKGQVIGIHATNLETKENRTVGDKEIIETIEKARTLVEG